MPGIDPTTFKGVADRMAAQWKLLRAAIIAAKAEGGGKYYTRIHLGVGGGDPQVESDFIKSANALDDDISSGIQAQTIYSSFLNAIRAHMNTNGARTLDNYLSMSGINVSAYFEEVYYLATGSHLNARNVFESPAGTILATYAVTGSSVGTYSHGTRVGLGSGTTDIDNHAAANLKIVPTADVGGTDIIVDLHMTQEAYPSGSSPTTLQVTIPYGTPAGTEIDVGTPDVDMYLDVTDIKVAGGSAGDGFKVVSAQERVEAL